MHGRLLGWTLRKGGPAPAPGLSLEWGALVGDEAGHNPSESEIPKKRALSCLSDIDSESGKIPGKK